MLYITATLYLSSLAYLLIELAISLAAAKRIDKQAEWSKRCIARIEAYHGKWPVNERG